jgi:hypothetical protein
MPQSQSFDDLVALFNLSRKREVEAHCRRLVVRSEEFAQVLLAARVAGLGPYVYANHFVEVAPATLVPTTEELSALGRNGLGRVAGGALKAVRKMDQMFKDRRLLAVHLFYSRSQKYWHMFHFDQRDYSDEKNHWAHGPHIHYSQHSFTREDLASVWRKLCQPEPVLPRSVHIRYDYHHNRRRAPGA